MQDAPATASRRVAPGPLALLKVSRPWRRVTMAVIGVTALANVTLLVLTRGL